MKRSAFTLIELLVVIAIIAILAAILFPVFAAAREQAKATNCLNNAGQLSRAMLMYNDSWDGRYPTPAWLGNKFSTDWVSVDPAHVGPGREFAIADVRRGAIYPFVKDVRVYRCMDDPTREAKTGRQLEITHMMNSAYEVYGKWPPIGMNSSRITFPAASIVLVEEGVLDRNTDNTPHNDGVLFVALYDIRDWHLGWARNDIPAGWHSGRSQYTFCDGHAKSLLQIDTIPRGGFTPPNFPRLFSWFGPTRTSDT